MCEKGFHRLITTDLKRSFFSFLLGNVLFPQRLFLRCFFTLPNDNSVFNMFAVGHCNNTGMTGVNTKILQESYSKAGFETPVEFCVSGTTAT